MYYCDDCRKKRGWPESFFSKSTGRCELCGNSAVCNDISSSQLPPAKESFTDIEKITELAGHRLPSIDSVLTPGSIVSTTGRYSEAFSRAIEYHMLSKGAVVLTNAVYEKYPEGLHHVESLSEIMKMTAVILNEGDHPLFISLDIPRDCFSKFSAAKARDFVLFTGITRKFRQTWNLQVKNWNLLPPLLKNWDFDILTGHFYTDATDTRGFNDDAGSAYNPSEIIFFEKQGFEVEVFTIENPPLPSRTPGKTFHFDTPFREIIHLVEKKTAEEIPKTLIKHYLRK